MTPHAALTLWDHQHPPTGYPTGVKAVPRPIVGTAFFPGGYGIWNPDFESPPPPLPVGGIMVLGHDFHSETGYTRSLALRHEPETIPTWRYLLDLFEEVGIDRTKCFFTNVYMGLRASKRTTGGFPGATDDVFVAFCVSFLVEQLRAQRPRVILTLGIHVPPLIGRLSPQLTKWTVREGFNYLDDVGPVQRDVCFPDLPDLRADVVALTHPSQRRLNVRLRKYNGSTGSGAEHAMLRQVFQSE